MEITTVPMSQGQDRPCTCRWPTGRLAHTRTRHPHVRTHAALRAASARGGTCTRFLKPNHSSARLISQTSFHHLSVIRSGPSSNFPGLKLDCNPELNRVVLSCAINLPGTGGWLMWWRIPPSWPQGCEELKLQMATKTLLSPEP